MKMENPLEPVGRAALAASREMLALEPQEKAQALRLMAAGVRSAAEKIVRENGLDMEEARKGSRNAAFLDRLLLTPERVEHMARGSDQRIELELALVNLAEPLLSKRYKASAFDAARKFVQDPNGKWMEYAYRAINEIDPHILKMNVLT